MDKSQQIKMKKGCEDCFFGTIFVILSFVFAFCYIYVFVLGDTKVLTKNFDCFGNICGEQRSVYDSSSSINMTTRKFLLHTSFSDVLNSVGVCVKQCPNETINSLKDLSEYLERTDNRLCDCRVPEKMQMSQPRIGNVHLCPELPVPETIPVRGLCVPVEWRINSRKFHSPEAASIRRENLLLIRIKEDVDLTFPWKAPVISLVLTWSFGILTLLCVLFFPAQSIPTIIVSAHVGLLGLIINLLVRVLLLHTNQQAVIWGTSYPFASLEQSNRIVSSLLIVSFILALIILDVTLFRLWRSAENWRRSQLLIVHTLLRLVSDAARGLPNLLTILPLFYAIGLYLLVGLSALIVVHMLSIVEPVRMRVTGCLALRQHAWVQFGLIPAHLLYSLWILRFYMALCQMSTCVLVIMWYNAAASSANIPITRFVGSLCHKLRKQFLGSVGLASLLSTLNWIPLQVLSCLRILIRQELIVNRREKSRTHRLWTLESLLRQFDCNIYTILACDQKTFSKSWSHLNTGVCEQSVPIKLTELMRWCEVLFTIGKWACSTVGTLIAFVYFSNKPPISQIFPSIILIAFLLCYLTASIVVGILQHILSTILICFCLQEEQRFTNEIMDEQVLIGFRHDEIKIKLAFLTEDKQARSSWPSLSIRRPRFSAEKRQQTRNHDKSVLHSDRLGHFDEISV